MTRRGRFLPPESTGVRHYATKALLPGRMWIRIRMDPHLFYLLDLDPEEKKFQKKGKEIANTCNFI